MFFFLKLIRYAKLSDHNDNVGKKLHQNEWKRFIKLTASGKKFQDYESISVPTHTTDWSSLRWQFYIHRLDSSQAKIFLGFDQDTHRSKAYQKRGGKRCNREKNRKFHKLLFPQCSSKQHCCEHFQLFSIIFSAVSEKCLRAGEKVSPFKLNHLSIYTGGCRLDFNKHKLRLGLSFAAEFNLVARCVLGTGWLNAA